MMRLVSTYFYKQLQFYVHRPILKDFPSIDQMDVRILSGNLSRAFVENTTLLIQGQH